VLSLVEDRAAAGLYTGRQHRRYSEYNEHEEPRRSRAIVDIAPTIIRVIALSLDATCPL
jgi:hypothetical protein